MSNFYSFLDFLNTSSKTELNSNKESGSELIVCFNRVGSRIFNGEPTFTLTPHLTPIEGAINKFLNVFFERTGTIRTLKQNDVHLRIPYSDLHSFVDLLLLESTNKRKMEMINKYIDFEEFYRFLVDDAKKFYDSLKEEPEDNKEIVNLDTAEITNEIQLKLFMEALFSDDTLEVFIYHPLGSYTLNPRLKPNVLKWIY